MFKVIVQIYLLILSSYHIFTGIVSYEFPQFALKFYKKLYDTNPVEKKFLLHILKPWGALAFFAGVVGYFPAYDPVKHWGIILGLWLLLAMRVLYRSRFHKDVENLGGVAPHRNVISIMQIVVGVVILGVWLVGLLVNGELVL